MIVTKTPVRITFIGGGTDYPEYFSKNGGEAIASCIDKFTYITVFHLKKLFDYGIRLSYARTELVDAIDVIEHPSIRECLRFTGIQEGIEIHYAGDLPARSGLGSSSSFTVGLLNALHAFKGEAVTSRQLAEEAVYIEREMIQERVGLQDQYTCSHGGLLHFKFSGTSSVEAKRIELRADLLQNLSDQLLLFYSGIRRRAHEVLETQIEKTKSGEIDKSLGQIRELVRPTLDCLTNGRNLKELGELLHECWMVKKKLTDQVSGFEIDEIYQRARAAGAIGGKLLGAGGGGFFLLFVEPKKQAAVRKALFDLHEVEFNFWDRGSEISFTDKAAPLQS